MSHEPSDRLTVLLLDYEMGRDDERGFVTSLVTLLGIATAVLAALITVLTQVCVDPAQATQFASCRILEPAILALFPLAPLTVIIFIQLVGSQAAIRSYYLRALEREIRKELGDTPGKGFSSEAYQNLPLLAAGEIQAEVQSLSHGTRAYRALTSIGLLAVVLVFGGATVYIAYFQDVSYKMLMLIGYAGNTKLVLQVTFRYTSRVGQFPACTVTGVSVRMREGLEPFRKEQRKGRSLISYIFLPRPDDLIKLAFLPAGACVALVVTKNDSRVAPALALWILLELFIYQARYQWNDLRGISEDSAHPLAQERGRLPISDDPRADVRTSLTSLLIRVAVGYAIARLPGMDIGDWYLLALGLVFALAFIYEALRGHGGKMRPVLAWAIYFTVGLGYAVRGCLGFAIIAGDSHRELAISLSLFLTAYGSTFVLLTWVLDAASYCHFTSQGHVQIVQRDALEAKPHLSRLVPAKSEATAGCPAEGKNVPVLRARGNLFESWNVATMASSILAAKLGMQLFFAVIGSGAQSTTASLVVGFLVGTVLIAAPSSPWRAGWGVVTSLVAATYAWHRADHFLGAAVATLPWLSVWLTVWAFRRSTYAEMKSLRGKLWILLRRVFACVTRILLGRETSQLLIRT